MDTGYGWSTAVSADTDTLYNRKPRSEWSQSRVEAVLNTSTVALRVVVGGEKGSLDSETVKYGHESHGTRTWEWLRWWGPADIVNDRPVLSSKGRPTLTIRNDLTVIKSARKPQMGAIFQDRLADWPSVVTQDSTRTESVVDQNWIERDQNGSRSDQNGASRRSDWRGYNQNWVSLRHSFIVRYCNLLWLRVIVQEVINKSNPKPFIISRALTFQIVLSKTLIWK
jgi:hypothetical protein